MTIRASLACAFTLLLCAMYSHHAQSESIRIMTTQYGLSGFMRDGKAMGSQYDTLNLIAETANLP